MTNEELIESLKVQKNLKECAEAINSIQKEDVELSQDVKDAVSKLDICSTAKFFYFCNPRCVRALREDEVFNRNIMSLLRPLTPNIFSSKVNTQTQAVPVTNYTFEQSSILPFLKGPLSQWHKESFIVDGTHYKTAEHYMMAQKAIFFEDQESYHLIMKSNSPKEVQAMGRMVSNFNDGTWSCAKALIVYNGNVAKFTQCKAAHDELMKTKGMFLAEGNPSDLVWGTGLSVDDPAILDKSRWKGKNFLGRILSLIRTELEEGTLTFVDKE